MLDRQIHTELDIREKQGDTEEKGRELAKSVHWRIILRSLAFDDGYDDEYTPSCSSIPVIICNLIQRYLCLTDPRGFIRGLGCHYHINHTRRLTLMDVQGQVTSDKRDAWGAARNIMVARLWLMPSSGITGSN